MAFLSHLLIQVEHMQVDAERVVHTAQSTMIRRAGLVRYDRNSVGGPYTFNLTKTPRL